MLRDQLVCGVNHKGIQHKLLAEIDLTFDKVYAIAQRMKSSDRDVKKLEKGQTTSTTKENELHFTRTVPKPQHSR